LIPSISRRKHNSAQNRDTSQRAKLAVGRSIWVLTWNR
jgi:hypothetical protein